MVRPLRLSTVREGILFARLGVSFGEVAKKMRKSPEALEEMGITPRGIDVRALRRFLETDNELLVNFPLRIRAGGFRAEALEAVLGRFGDSEVTLVEKYARYSPVAQSLAEKLLRAYVDADVIAFLNSLVNLKSEEINELKKERGMEKKDFFNALDFAGLMPDVSKLNTSYLMGIKDAFELNDDVKSFFPQLCNQVLRSAIKTDKSGAYLFVAFLTAGAGDERSASYNAMMALRSSSRGPERDLPRAFARFTKADIIDRLLLFERARDLEGIIEISGEFSNPLTDGFLKRFYEGYLNILKYLYLTSLGLNERTIRRDYPLGLINYMKNYHAVIEVAYNRRVKHAHLVEISDLSLYIINTYSRGREIFFEWLCEVAEGEFAGMDILVLTDDVSEGKKIGLIRDELERLKPRRIGLLLTNPEAYTNINAEILKRFDDVRFLEKVSGEIEHAEAVNTLQTFIRRQWALFERDDEGECIKEILGRIDEKLKRGKNTRRKTYLYALTFNVASMALENELTALAAKAGLKWIKNQCPA